MAPPQKKKIGYFGKNRFPEGEHPWMNKAQTSQKTTLHQKTLNKIPVIIVVLYSGMEDCQTVIKMLHENKLYRYFSFTLIDSN